MLQKKLASQQVTDLCNAVISKAQILQMINYHIGTLTSDELTQTNLVIEKVSCHSKLKCIMKHMSIQQSKLEGKHALSAQSIVFVQQEAANIAIPYSCGTAVV